MKLYEVQRNTWVKVLEYTRVPPAAPEINYGGAIFFRHIDGMYSFCTTHDRDDIKDEDIIHLIAWTEVIPTQKP